MEIITPWVTSIAKINVAGQYDMDLFAAEVFGLTQSAGQEDSSQKHLTTEMFPTILHMRDEVIVPKVNEFAKQFFSEEMGKYYVETNAKWIPEGEGLYPHYHPGSVFSAICYPVDSENAMTMFDPRGNAGRGYPKSMRQHHFANYRISPRAGDIYIFPSYIQHSVSYVTDQLRLSLLHEFYVTRDL